MKSLESMAFEKLIQIETLSLSSVTENGYPYICPMEKVMVNGLQKIYFITSKSSRKVKYFRNNEKAGVNYFLEDDSVSLNGIINIIENVESEIISLPHQYVERLNKRDSSKYCILEFITMEAKIFIDGKFEIVSYTR